MSTFSVLNPAIHIHDLDFTTYLKQATLSSEAAELDVTTFGSTFRSRLGGLKTIACSGDGFWDSVPDLATFSALGIADRVFTVSPQGAETNIAYLFQAGKFEYTSFDANVGDAAPFAFAASGTNGVGMVRGQLVKAKGNVSATGQLGSVVTLTTVGATQFLYASFHIFTAGTTITIQVQSDDNGGMSSPTTRATIGPLTTTGGTFMTRVAGPIATDTFWRYNVSAITGTFNVAGAIGIQ